jgi:hypothetical protein
LKVVLVEIAGLAMREEQVSDPLLEKKSFRFARDRGYFQSWSCEPEMDCRERILRSVTPMPADVAWLQVKVLLTMIRRAARVRHWCRRTSPVQS